MKGEAYMERVLLNKIESIERCVGRLREIYGGKPERLEDYLYQDAIVLNVQRACQQAIDLAMYLVSKTGMGLPKASKEAFQLLEKNNVIDKNLSKSLQGMVGFRNIAIHEYQNLDLNILKSILEEHTEDFLKYTKSILSYLKNKNTK